MMQFLAGRRLCFVVIFLLFLASLPFAFCSLPFDFFFASPQTLASPVSEPRGPVERAVVQLLAVGPGADGKNCKISATGFFVNAEGHLLTNAHVVDDARRCLATSAEGKILAKLASPAGRAAPAVSCEVVGVDEVHDLAVLKTARRQAEVPGAADAPFARLDAEGAQPGTPVMLTGYPTFAWHAVTKLGQVVRRDPLRLERTNTHPTEVLSVNIALQVGNSGSPVYLATGGVVAIVERKDPLNSSNTLAISSRHAIELLDRLGVKWSRP